METRARILLADDHVIFSDTLRLMLERLYEVVGAVADGLGLVSEAVRLRPDVIIVDVGMPLLNGLDAAQRVREALPDVKLVFLTMQDNRNLAAAAIEMGSAAFVLKRSAGAELLLAIDEVLHGKCYLTPKLRPDDWLEQKNRARQYSRDLTPRQREILQMYAEGRPIKEIAGHLNLSEKTVEFHKHHIIESFGLKNNADLVLFALQKGLISLDQISPSKSSP